MTHYDAPDHPCGVCAGRTAEYAALYRTCPNGHDADASERRHCTTCGAAFADGTRRVDWYCRECAPGELIAKTRAALGGGITAGLSVTALPECCTNALGVHLTPCACDCHP